MFLMFAVFLNACNSKANKDQSKNSNLLTTTVSYFGQKPPGMTAEVFAPGVVSVNGRYEYAVSFSPQLDEIYFSGNKKGGHSRAYSSKLNDGKWTQPQLINFTNGKKSSEFQTCINPEGNKIYYAADEPGNAKIWQSNRVGDSWKEAKALELPINDDIVFYPNMAKNGDLFYTNLSKRKVYYAPNKDGKYPEVKEVGIEYGLHGFTSPGQDFILVDARKENDKTKDRDIHVCFKKEDGTWTSPIKLGPAVNSDFTETCPSLTPDGKYLFFSRYNEEGGLSNIYWISAEVINQVRPVDL
ncbi:hypothetical protein BKI52_29580 [marine bacterium AO1-C]|nr:hypothetical protein BKI52_29580 [marine bacterium AO1-C]